MTLGVSRKCHCRRTLNRDMVGPYDKMIGEMRVHNTSDNSLLDQLTAEHQAMKTRLRELEKHRVLTSAEQIEYAQLKKNKLRTKDKIRILLKN